MAGIFGGGGSKAPPPPAPVPVPKKDDGEVQRQAAEEARRRRLAMGRNATILSKSGPNVANEDSAPSTRKSLLGS